jgi:hypothetical protein
MELWPIVIMVVIRIVTYCHGDCNYSSLVAIGIVFTQSSSLPLLVVITVEHSP